VEAVGVDGQDGGPLPMADAEALKRGRETGDPVDRLGVGAYATGADGGGRIRPLLHGAVQTLREIHAGLRSGVIHRDSSIAGLYISEVNVNKGDYSETRTRGAIPGQGQEAS
jgi:hypothetical protein